jgi:hypothetical protein
MAFTYEPIATVNVSTQVSSYTFSSIPSIYTDLIVVLNSGSSIANNSFALRFNGDSGNNYSNTGIYGNGSSVASTRESNQPYIYFANTISVTDTVGNAIYIVNINNYSNTTTNKSVIARNDIAAKGTELVVGLWRNTSAINSILFSYTGGEIKVGSTITIYGILKA